MTLVVLGDLMVDVVARAAGPLARGSDTPAGVSVRGGGSGANVAAWAAALGAPVALACRVGDDERGRTAVADLRARGVDVRAEIDPERPTGTCVVVVEPDGERTMLPDAGANDGPPELPDELLARGGLLHVIGYALLREGPRAGTLAAIARARAAGMAISIDPSSWALLRPGALPPAELLLPNEREVAVLARDEDPERAARALASRTGRESPGWERGESPAGATAEWLGVAREVVVKLGPAGALWTDGTDVERVPAEPVEVVDTTGAGDAFAAGLLVARLDGAGPREALTEGCRTAAHAVGRLGGRPS